jgi:ubiquinone biosynthesis protein UbiJ
LLQAQLDQAMAQQWQEQQAIPQPTSGRSERGSGCESARCEAPAQLLAPITYTASAARAGAAARQLTLTYRAAPTLVRRSVASSIHEHLHAAAELLTQQEQMQRQAHELAAEAAHNQVLRAHALRLPRRNFSF